MNLQTEVEFLLPRGFVDESGQTHRSGRMRLATALRRGRVRRPSARQPTKAYSPIVLLSRVITRLGRSSRSRLASSNSFLLPTWPIWRRVPALEQLRRHAHPSDVPTLWLGAVSESRTAHRAGVRPHLRREDAIRDCKLRGNLLTQSEGPCLTATTPIESPADPEQSASDRQGARAVPDDVVRQVADRVPCHAGTGSGDRTRASAAIANVRKGRLECLKTRYARQPTQRSALSSRSMERDRLRSRSAHCPLIELDVEPRQRGRAEHLCASASAQRGRPNSA